jgi:hypothetical protein
MTALAALIGFAFGIEVTFATMHRGLDAVQFVNCNKADKQ